jgi:Family of unknown function (DUF5367)
MWYNIECTKWYISLTVLEQQMTTHNKLLLGLFGAGFWIVGTIWYELRGPQVFESGSQRYWINFVLTPIFSAVVCIILLKWRHVPAVDWSSAALLIALPGMFGEAVLLSRFSAFMPRMHPATAGKYGAFLFASYALFLTIAEIVTVRATGFHGG